MYDGTTSETTGDCQWKSDPSKFIEASISEGLTGPDENEAGSQDKADEGKMKKLLRLIMSSYAFGLFGALLILLDVALVLTDLMFKNQVSIPMECRFVSMGIAVFFFVDLLARTFVEGKQRYFTDLFKILDGFIIVTILVIDIFYIAQDTKSIRYIPRWPVLLRPLWIVVMIRAFYQTWKKKREEKVVKRTISGNKTQHTKEEFDLDLTYITDHIIAMSYPAAGKHSLYRNKMTEVVRFLDMKHPNHYQVYNLCSERGYNPKHFHHRVCRLMIDDHNVPTLREMLVFSQEVEKWLAQDEENVIVLHSKKGKGRTGIMACAYLIARGICVNEEDSLRFFQERRTSASNTSKSGSFETPSQRRYIAYFAQLKNIYQLNLPPQKTLRIKKIIIYSIHGVGQGNGNDLKLQILMQRKIVLASKNYKILYDMESNRVVIHLFHCPPLSDDVKVQFFSSSNLPKCYDNCAFFFWFHTSFIKKNRLYLPREQLDNPHKPRTWSVYQPNFAVEVYFEDV
ncbi:phosphatidylinositol 3,4,5-trisphosphate 3-phosphatase TPTE2-like [Nycticebus coucang]|uniref:phosphatidylinositol 3,4,5-trisphosphate 3-phosphatase TPTE2-like n=1 Tax=Nycticebus coucang TaxID=9470 RepID=UPI00234E1DE3|nr:phosphatidylinositol 3,4,5-trisphosphate 3-phosphatase TPTE2-like [Nycticebus coucang]